MFTRGRVNVFSICYYYQYYHEFSVTKTIQYRYGTTTKIAAQTLWKEGGIRRFYRGIGPALFVS